MKVLYITCLHCTQDMAVCIVCLSLLIMYVHIAVECIISAYRIIIHTNTYEAEKGQDQLQLSGYTIHVFGNCSQMQYVLLVMKCTNALGLHLYILCTCGVLGAYTMGTQGLQ